MKVLLLGDARTLSRTVALQGCRVIQDPGDSPDAVISDVVACGFAPEGIPLIVLGTGTVADWVARQKRPDAAFVQKPEDALRKLSELNPVHLRKAGERRLVLTYSNKGGAGKTTAAVSIALTLAECGVKTALCDFDLAAPDIATYFNLNPKKGIEGILEGDDPLIQAAENLWVLPEPVSAEIPRLSGDDLIGVVNDLMGRFRVVVGDTPPAPFEKEFLHPLFARADLVCAVVDQSKFTVRETEVYAPTLLAMGVDPGSISIIVNKYNPKLTSLRQIESAFCAGFRKNVRTLPCIAAVIPEGWEEQVKAGFQGSVLNQEEWLKIVREIVPGASVGAVRQKQRKKRGGLLGWLKR